MGFLRRILGGGDRDEADTTDDAERASPPADAATIDEEERARELELARFDQERLDDLVRRQQRYADRSWDAADAGR